MDSVLTFCGSRLQDYYLCNMIYRHCLAPTSLWLRNFTINNKNKITTTFGKKVLCQKRTVCHEISSHSKFTRRVKNWQPDHLTIVTVRVKQSDQMTRSRLLRCETIYIMNWADAGEYDTKYTHSGIQTRYWHRQ